MKVDEAPHLRSALFVPGHRADFLAKALAGAADALIVDLEDSVAASGRAAARDHVRDLVADPRPDGPRLCVRVHAVGHPEHEADVAAAVGPGLLALVLPKVTGADDVRALDARLTVQSALRIWPLLENARAVQRSAEIAEASARIAYLGGGTSRNGDLAASLGYVWTAEGTETLYVRSKVLLDARAAGVPYPMTGVVTALDDPAVVQHFAEQSRGLGYDGLMVIHPSHVDVANRVFGSSADERAWAQATLAALDAAALSGDGAARVGTDMVDEAMRATAEKVLARRAAPD